MNKIGFALWVIAVCMVLSGCNSSELSAAASVQEDARTTPDIADTSEFLITKDANCYRIIVYDRNNLPFDELGPFSKEPEVVWVNENMLRVGMQAGTGKETKWGIYYDLANHRQSEAYYGILAESNRFIAYCGVKKIVVQDPFDEDQFYREITTFPAGLSPTASPFVGAQFADDYTVIVITYLSGDDYHLETTVIPLQ